MFYYRLTLASDTLTEMDITCITAQTTASIPTKFCSRPNTQHGLHNGG